MLRTSAPRPSLTRQAPARPEDHGHALGGVDLPGLAVCHAAPGLAAARGRGLQLALVRDAPDPAQDRPPRQAELEDHPQAGGHGPARGGLRARSARTLREGEHLDPVASDEAASQVPQVLHEAISATEARERIRKLTVFRIELHIDVPSEEVVSGIVSPEPLQQLFPALGRLRIPAVKIILPRPSQSRTHVAQSFGRTPDSAVQQGARG
mmetsp:Transcript_44740/g.127715  ORF Transcript_44740/g.127715 Transcript_44740/m.127715 type:complete len:209 (+) Transcript_44740:183-809(+)